MNVNRLTLDHFTLTITAEPSSPNILTIPHDGILNKHLRIPLPERTEGIKVRDGAIWNIVEDINTITTTNIVRGLLPRTLIDYNRDSIEAYEHEALETPYLAYHSQIIKILNSLKTIFPLEKILLLDMHGFATQPSYAPINGFDVILGTGNRTTVPHGDVDRLFAAFLRNLNYSIFLPETNPVQSKGDYLDGNFTVRNYSATHGVNCIQVEISRRFRENGAEHLGKRLAGDISAFLENSAHS